MVNELVDIHSIRVKDDDTIEVLIDPWSTKASVWEVNVNTLYKTKIRDFFEYKDQPYTEKINW